MKPDLSHTDFDGFEHSHRSRGAKHRSCGAKSHLNEFEREARRLAARRALRRRIAIAVCVALLSGLAAWGLLWWALQRTP